MKKLSAFVLAMVMLCSLTSCGSADDSSATATTVPAESVTAETFTSKVYKDNEQMNEGVTIDDAEFNADVSKFISDCTANCAVNTDYDPASADTPKGAYLKIETSNSHSVYISDTQTSIVAIDGVYYDTQNGEAQDFMSKTTTYLTDKGYWGK